jgi:uncharacterized protein YndB with AHSA1/START domain
MAEAGFLDFHRVICAPPEAVFRAFTHATLLRDWLCQSCSIDPREGGYFFLRWENGKSITGTYSVFHKPDRLEFFWMDVENPGPLQVRLDLAPEGSDTRLDLHISGLGSGPAWDYATARLNDVWNTALDDLCPLLQTGIDQRLLRRARLGILIDELTPEIASRLGLPSTQGVLLGGTADHSGARAAGLQKDDVLVSFNGVQLADYHSIGQGLLGLKPGDRAVVEYIRASEKNSLQVELGATLVEPVPETAQELAEKVRENTAKVLAAMRKQVAGLSESQVAQRPAVDEWSVNELVAHFILCERDYQSWVAQMLNDRPVDDWLEMRPNVNPRIQAMTQRFSAGRNAGLDGLLEEFALAAAETADMIAAFPEEFVTSRRHLYRRAATWALETIPSHYFDEHQGQFQAAIDAARQVTAREDAAREDTAR